MNQNRHFSCQERVEVICEGLLQDKSLSAIAMELGRTASWLRRDFNILLRTQVPREWGNFAGQGAASESILRLALRDEAMSYIRSGRLPCEVGAGIISDEVADAGLKYLKKHDIGQTEEIMILDQVGRNLCTLGDLIAMPREDNLHRVFARCEPGELPSNQPDRIQFLVSAITRALPLLAPEILVRERAIEKMKEAAKNPKRRARHAAAVLRRERASSQAVVARDLVQEQKAPSMGRKEQRYRRQLFLLALSNRQWLD